LLRARLLGFPRDRYPASTLARWLLPSNGFGANHMENTAPVFLAACLFERVYVETVFFLAPQLNALSKSTTVYLLLVYSLYF
jgi:hypothetical protein